jgi:L-histidine Nalpha-methyltransferase
MQIQKPFAPSTDSAPRVRVRAFLKPGEGSTLAADVRRGLAAPQKTLPPKHFYDATGSRLFEQICETPEYYPTRTELGLLEQLSDVWMPGLQPTDLIELGSGGPRKIRILLRAAERAALRVRYVPFDVSEAILVDSARHLTREHAWLEVHGIVGDYERHLHHLPAGKRRLLMFLGGTIGNFEHAEAVHFLSHLAAHMGPEDRLLLGTDLVKPTAILEAAYNDAAGVTAAFNKNVLAVINRELGGDFHADDFDHVAFFAEESRQIEMHLRARVDQHVTIAALGLSVPFAAGETLRTEISRKFTETSVLELLEAAGLERVGWYTPPSGYFGLSLSRKRAS